MSAGHANILPLSLEYTKCAHPPKILFASKETEHNDCIFDVPLLSVAIAAALLHSLPIATQAIVTGAILHIWMSYILWGAGQFICHLGFALIFKFD